MLLELLPRIAPEAKPTVLAQYASIDIPGMADDNSVSYVAIAYSEKGATAGEPLREPPGHAVCPVDAPPLDDAVGEHLVRIARATLRSGGAIQR